jgi:hypothetical protein
VELPKKEFLNYEEAKIFLSTFKLQTRSEYNILRQSNNEVRRLCPAKPEYHYIDYKSIYDYLSINKTAKKDLPVIVQRKKYLPYSEIIRRIRSYGIQSKKQWDELVKKPGEPDDLNIYKQHGFRSYRYLFGSKDHLNDKYLPFDRATEFVKSQDITTSREYTIAIKEGRLPKTLPASPHVVYASQWSGWKDFTGGRMKMATYEQLMDIVQKEGISSYMMYLEFREAYKGNLRLPAKPSDTYKGEFVSYTELFGRKNKFAGLRKQNAKSLLQRVESEIGTPLSSFNDAEVLFILENTAAGRALLLSSMTLDNILDMNRKLDKSPFDLSQGDSAERLGNFLAQLKPRDGGVHSDHLEITTDQAVCEVLLSRCISKEEFRKKVITSNYSSLAKLRNTLIAASRLPGLTKKQCEMLSVPGLNFMQKYTAFAMANNDRFGNWSGTGAGKTLAAAYAAHVNGFKRVLVVTAGQVFSNWEKTFNGLRPKEELTINAFDEFPQDAWVNIVNYEKMQSFRRGYRISQLLKHNYDLIIFDESHLMKEGAQGKVSFKRESISLLLESYKGKFLMLSATPFVNNLKEAIGCLRMIDPTIDIPTSPIARNLINFNRAFWRLGVRYCPVLPVQLVEHYIDIEKAPGFYESIGVGGSILAVERVLTAHRVAAASDIIEKGTVIYTFYVAGIIDQIKAMVAAKGLSFGIYTGDEKSGLDQFISGKRDVLICSRAMSTGYDGLQKRVSKIIIACPMWTSTEYDQFVGRFFRQGSKFSSVSVYRMRIIEKGFQLDKNWDILRWNKIIGKKELLASVMDGVMPTSLLFDKHKMLRLFRESIDEMSVRYR